MEIGAEFRSVVSLEGRRGVIDCSGGCRFGAAPRPHSDFSECLVGTRSESTLDACFGGLENEPTGGEQGTKGGEEFHSDL